MHSPMRRLGTLWAGLVAIAAGVGILAQAGSGGAGTPNPPRAGRKTVSPAAVASCVPEGSERIAVEELVKAAEPAAAQTGKLHLELRGSRVLFRPGQVILDRGLHERFGYGLESIRAGTRAIYDAKLEGRVRPRQTHRGVSFDRGRVRECYRIVGEELEQFFILGDRPRGDGDLVVTGRVQTRLTPISDGPQEIVLGWKGQPSLRIHDAVAIDATGSQRALALHYDSKGRRLSVTVPDAWLAQAVYPVVIDPLIGFPFPVDGRIEIVESDHRHSQSGGRYLTLLQTADGWRGQFLRSWDGSPDGPRFEVPIPEAVAYLPSVDKYLLVSAEWSVEAALLHFHLMDGRSGIVNSVGSYGRANTEEEEYEFLAVAVSAMGTEWFVGFMLETAYAQNSDVTLSAEAMTVTSSGHSGSYAIVLREETYDWTSREGHDWSYDPPRAVAIYDNASAVPVALLTWSDTGYTAAGTPYSAVFAYAVASTYAGLVRRGSRVVEGIASENAWVYAPYAAADDDGDEFLLVWNRVYDSYASVRAQRCTRFGASAANFWIKGGPSQTGADFETAGVVYSPPGDPSGQYLIVWDDGMDVYASTVLSGGDGVFEQEIRIAATGYRDYSILATINRADSHVLILLNIGNRSFGQIYEVRTVPPLLLIDEGAAWTREREVSVRILAVGEPAWMRFSEDGVNWSALEEYAATKLWWFGGGQASRQLAVRFWYADGRISDAAIDRIGLDMTAPAGTLEINGGALHTRDWQVRLTVAATDDLSGPEEMRFSGDGVNWDDWQLCGGAVDWTLTGADGRKTVYAQVRDGAGNESVPFSSTIVLDTTGPSGTITIDGGAAETDARVVTLALTTDDGGGSGAARMRFADDGDEWSEWATYASTATWTLKNVRGMRSVSAQFEDALGNVSGIVTDTISLLPCITIGEGAVYATSLNVNLALTAPEGAAYVRFSENEVDWGDWVAFQEIMTYAMSPGEGTRIVYAEFRDGAGLSLGSFSDSIIVDTIAPVGTIFINGDGFWDTYHTNSPDILVAFSDDGSGAAEMRIQYEDTVGPWLPYPTSGNWTLARDGFHRFWVHARDMAGNVRVLFRGVRLDRVPPTIRSFSINGGAVTTDSLEVELHAWAVDDYLARQFRFSNDRESWSPWSIYDRVGWTLSFGDGGKTVWVQVRDWAGNVSEATDTIVLDTAPPSGTLAINGGAAHTNSTQVVLNCTATDAGLGVADMRLSSDGGDWGPWQPYVESVTWTLAPGDGAKTVWVEYQDSAGHVSSPASDTIVLDTVAPVGNLTINSGTSITNSAAVALGLSATDGGSGVARMSFSNDGTNWSPWMPYASSASWTLPWGDGAKTVHARFQDGAGTESAVATAGIVLDATRPQVTINQSAGQPDPTTEPVVRFTVVFSERVSGFTAASVEIGGTVRPTEVQVSGTGPAYTVVVRGLRSAGTVWARVRAGAVRDAAGNLNAASTSTDNSVRYLGAFPKVQ